MRRYGRNPVLRAMPLKIETYDNSRGGNSFYKAVTHPLAARRAAALLDRLNASGPVAIYDPLGTFGGFAEFYDLSRLDVAGAYVQDLEAIGRPLLGRPAQPVTALEESGARAVFVAAFDAERLVAQARHLLPEGAAVESLDSLRLPDEWLTDPRRYLDPLNFATNFVFFRDEGSRHTRLSTINYWQRYGARDVVLRCVLFDADGRTLAEWEDRVGDGPGTIAIDSREVRRRFDLPEFAGQLFLHAVGIAGHDVVKYALDTFADGAGDEELSCTHDANSWPADLYAGLPAPRPGERVLLWAQNSHPRPIAAGEIALRRMGAGEERRIERAIPPFASAAIDVAELFPELRWPAQLELMAGKHMVRPRYEVLGAREGGGAHRRIAHVNVERTDLKPDPRIPELGNLLGKGYLLPAPVLPRARWRSLLLPTPMATDQAELPTAALIYDRAGRQVAARRLGRLPRDHALALDLDELVGDADLPGGFGHVELLYDFAEGGAADGWLHALFRYEDRASRHAAETSFGAHVFNTVLTYRNEPQSYAGRAPGLSTRLFLRLGGEGRDTFCHLIYPASTPWHAKSETDLLLHDRDGHEVARERVAIPCSGSLFWRHSELFGAAARARAGENGYVIVRDATCRLFGYHGLLGAGGSFSLDHMFGF